MERCDESCLADASMGDGALDGGAVPRLAERIRQCCCWGVRLVLQTRSLESIIKRLDVIGNSRQEGVILYYESESKFEPIVYLCSFLRQAGAPMSKNETWLRIVIH